MGSFAAGSSKAMLMGVWQGMAMDADNEACTPCGGAACGRLLTFWILSLKSTNYALRIFLLIHPRGRRIFAGISYSKLISLLQEFVVDGVVIPRFQHILNLVSVFIMMIQGLSTSKKKANEMELQVDFFLN
jgi:hypothetical protein